MFMYSTVIHSGN